MAHFDWVLIKKPQTYGCCRLYQFLHFKGHDERNIDRISAITTGIKESTSFLESAQAKDSANALLDTTALHRD